MVSSVSGSSGIQQLLQNLSAGSSQSTGSVAPSDSTSTSDPGKMFQELESLAKSDPSKFKEVTGEIAQKLKDQANSTTDSNAQQFLSSLADKFTQASQTGDISSIEPPKGPPPGGAPPSGAQAYGRSQNDGAQDSLMSVFQSIAQLVDTAYQSSSAASSSGSSST